MSAGVCLSEFIPPKTARIAHKLKIVGGSGTCTGSSQHTYFQGALDLNENYSIDVSPNRELRAMYMCIVKSVLGLLEKCLCTCPNSKGSRVALTWPK